MKILKTLFLFVFAGTLFTACSPTLSPFTQQLYDKNRWGENELKQIQFYLSDDVVMHRQVSGGSSEIISGEIKMIDGKKVEEVKIRKGTPGVLLFLPKNNHFAVSFEDGNNERFLVFGPNPKANGRYVLLASEWKRQGGKVSYEGKKYHVSAHNAFASLMVDLKKINRTSVSSRTAKGRTVNN